MKGQHLLAIAALSAIAALPAQAENGADDRQNHEATTEASSEQLQNDHRDRAEKATTRAALQAIEAVLETNRLDLDIKLIGPTSKKIAGDR